MLYLVNWPFTVKHAPGGSTQQSFVRGCSAPRSEPLPFHILFLTEKVPLSYTFRSCLKKNGNKTKFIASDRKRQALKIRLTATHAVNWTRKSIEKKRYKKIFYTLSEFCFLAQEQGAVRGLLRGTARWRWSCPLLRPIFRKSRYFFGPGTVF